MGDELDAGRVFHRRPARARGEDARRLRFTDPHAGGLPHRTAYAGGGARIALGNAWTTLVAAELLAATAGLGYIALNASRTLEMGILLVAMGIIGLLGALFSIGMQLVTRWVAPWAKGGVAT